MELNDKNIVNVLHEADFADAHWELLGKQLIKRSALLNIRANRHGDSSLCMIDTIAQWLRTDATKSWEKLADAIAKVEEYGEATADTVRREAGIGKATELNQNMKNIWVTSTIVWSSQLYACCVCDTLQTSRDAIPISF